MDTVLRIPLLNAFQTSQIMEQIFKKTLNLIKEKKITCNHQ